MSTLTFYLLVILLILNSLKEGIYTRFWLLLLSIDSKLSRSYSGCQYPFILKSLHSHGVHDKQFAVTLSQLQIVTSNYIEALAI